MRPKMLTPKDPGAIVTITFDFVDQLGPVATIASADAVTVSVDRGGTDNTPSAMLNGASTTSGTKVYQSATLGTDGIDYKFRSRITTNESPPRKLVLTAILPVRTA